MSRWRAELVRCRFGLLVPRITRTFVDTRAVIVVIKIGYGTARVIFWLRSRS